MKTRIISALSALALAAPLLLNATAVAAAADPAPIFDPSGYKMGSGVDAYFETEIKQSGAKDVVLRRIREIRQDALNTNVKWPKMDSATTLRQYLKQKGISESAYLNPKWSREAEYLAIERAAETHSMQYIGHARLNDEYRTLTWGSYPFNAENIAWGSFNFLDSINQFYEEKSDWTGRTGGVTGHYTTMIDPIYTHYAMAGMVKDAQPRTYPTTWVMLGNLPKAFNENPLNTDGRYRFLLKLHPSLLANGLKLESQNLKTGSSMRAIAYNKPIRATLSGRNYQAVADRYSFIGTWTSSNPGVVTVQGDQIKALKAGTATLTLRTADGSKFPISVTVTDPKITKVSSLAPVTTPSGTAPTLPSTVKVTYDDGTGAAVPVTWEDISKYRSQWNSRTGGQFSVSGTVKGWASPVTVTVKVTPASLSKVYFDETGKNEISVTIESGASLANLLPKSAVALWSNSSVTVTSISWPNDDRNMRREGGSYVLSTTAYGKALYARITVKPARVVRVKDLPLVTTSVQKYPALPSTAEVVWSNGDVTRETVQWSRIPANKLAQEGLISVQGSIPSLGASDPGVSVQVRVKAVYILRTDMKSRIPSSVPFRGALRGPYAATVTYSDGSSKVAAVRCSYKSSDFANPKGSTVAIKCFLESNPSWSEWVNIRQLPAVVVRAQAPNNGIISPFRDVNTRSPHGAEVIALNQSGVMRGWPDGTFRPFRVMDRATMAAFMYRLAGSPQVDLTATKFTDVHRGHPFFKEIMWMKASGISTGWPDGTYRPWEPISREAMAAFMYRFAGYDKTKVAEATRIEWYQPYEGSGFRDVPSNHMFYREIKWLANAKISTGWPDGTFRPRASMDRHSMAAFIYRLQHNYWQ